MITTATPDWLRLYLDAWDPSKRAVHCSNCKHAKVFGEPDNPRTYCAKLQDSTKDRQLAVLVRPKNPCGWRDAAKCEHFTSMSDEGV